MDAAGLSHDIAAVLGLLLMVAATLALLIVMPPVEGFCRIRDRLRGIRPADSGPMPELEVEE